MPLRMYHNLEDDPRVRVVGLAVQEPFVVYMKAAFVVGAVAGQPVRVLLHLAVRGGGAVSAREEVRPHVPAVQPGAVPGRAWRWRSLSCFDSCWRSCFTFYDWMGIDPDPRITDWLTFVLILPLGFGISFQLPLVMLFLERIGIFTVGAYTSHWRISVLVIFVLAMVLTPSDPYSMMLMAVPLIAAVLRRRRHVPADAATRIVPRPSRELTVETATKARRSGAAAGRGRVFEECGPGRPPW